MSQEAGAVNGLVTSYVSSHHVPGLSVAVIERGHVILTQGYGFADVENGVPATADTDVVAPQ
jgi:D-alanyl-D-alanine carboxypeptidase